MVPLGSEDGLPTGPTIRAALAVRLLAASSPCAVTLPRVTAQALKHRLGASAGRTAGSAALAVLVAAWSAVAVAGFTGRLVVPQPFLVAALLPMALGAWIATGSRPATASVRVAAAWAAILAGGLLGATLVTLLPLAALIVPLILISAVLCARYPGAAVVGAFVLTGTLNTVTVFTPLPVGETVDLILAGLLVSIVWNYALHRRDRPLWLWPGAVASVLYLFFTGLEIFTADVTFNALYAFRVSAWYMLAFLLIGYARWHPSTYRRIARGVTAVAAAVGAYALLRWIIGPADAEEAEALAAAGTYNFVNEDFRLIGSFPSGHHLAGWTAIMTPFCVACALSHPGRWRVTAGTAAALCSLAVLASEVRTGLVAAAAGVAIVVLLYQLSRGFPGPHLGATAGAVVAAAVVAVVAFSLAVGGSEESRSRYTVLTRPSEDAAFQDRTAKWRTALAEIRRHPLGQGLGSGGQTHQRYGRFRTIASQDVDNSYLKIALDQGMAVMVFFAFSALMLLYGLARRAAFTGSRESAGVAMGAAGALAAFLILMSTGVYIEGLTALAAWMLVGLGVSQFAGPRGT